MSVIDMGGDDYEPEQDSDSGDGEESVEVRRRGRPKGVKETAPRRRSRRAVNRTIKGIGRVPGWIIDASADFFEFEEERRDENVFMHVCKMHFDNSATGRREMEVEQYLQRAEADLKAAGVDPNDLKRDLGCWGIALRAAAKANDFLLVMAAINETLQTQIGRGGK